MSEEEELIMKVEFNERTARALSSAIDFTLEKWVGQEPIDQEVLIAMKHAFHGMLLEFNFNRDAPRLE